MKHKRVIPDHYTEWPYDAWYRIFGVVLTFVREWCSVLHSNLSNFYGWLLTAVSSIYGWSLPVFNSIYGWSLTVVDFINDCSLTVVDFINGLSLTVVDFLW